VTFNPGTYWFKGGLTTSGATTTTMGTGTYIFGTAATPPATATFTIGNGSNVNSVAAGVLCYLEGGSAALSGGTSTSILGESQNYGVAIWDSVNSPNTSVAITNGAGTTANYGGIYVPFGQTVVSGNGQVNITFVVTNTASFSGSGTLHLG
jgi:hypothetical protein